MATNITQNLEGITKQFLDINRNYINKSIDVIGKLKNSPTQKITNINQDLIADVFNGIVKLNLDYYSKLIDYGFAVTNKILSVPENRLGENEEQGSSFTLAGKGSAGSSIDISFVLDNSKSEKAFCQLENTPFVSIDEHKENPDITVSFQPQSFDLEAGKSESISVLCSVSEKSAAGTFYSYARVIGFEPAYFTIVLTIEQNTKQDAINTQPAKKPPQKNSSKEKGSERIMSSAQRIVSSAVNVLEEEIAAGILAAKKLETKFINVEEVRNNQDELMNRIRRDTHEAVDLFLDAFATLAQQLNGITERAKTGNAEKSAVIQKKSTENLSQPVFLESDKILKPGESVSFQIVISDDDNEVQISLTKSDFIGYDNKKISSRNILIKPNSVLLKAKEKVEIHIVVKIPKNATSGFYRAILSDKLNPKTVILITLQIDE